MIPEHMRKRYEAYIASDKWKKLREKVVMFTYHNDSKYDLSRGCFYCQFCGWNYHKHELEVHHLHYDTLENETRKDLAVVCKRCHDFLDEIRRKKGEEARRRAYENAGFEGWASKVHGEDWMIDYDYSDIYEDYEEFAQRKAEEEYFC